MSPILLWLLTMTAKVTAILTIAGLITAVLHRASAAARHAIWAVAFAAVLLLPVASLLAPVVSVPVLPSATVVLPSANTPAPVEEGVAEPVSSGLEPVRIGSRSTGAQPKSSVPLNLPLTAALGWLLGVLGFLGYVAAGEWRIRRLGRRLGQAPGPEWAALVAPACRAIGVRRRFAVLEMPNDTVPMTYGWIRPVVLVPASGREWSATHRHDVLVHELAHVARFDCLTHGIARLAAALFWYNPLMWVALRRARLEREQACDDMVLAAGATPSRYAEELLTTASQGSAWAPSAGLGMARPSTLSSRLMAVLDRSRVRTGLAKRNVATLTMLAAVSLVPISGLTPVQQNSAVARLSAEGPQSEPLPTPTARAADPTTPTPPVIVAAPANPVAYSDSIVPPRATLPPANIPVEPTVTVLSADQGQLVRLSGERLLTAFQRLWQSRPNTEPCQVTTSGNREVKVSSTMSISGEGNVSDGQSSYVVWTGRDCAVTIRVNGKVTFTADESDVTTLPRAGRFTVTHSDGNNEREYDVRLRNGALERRYTVNGDEAAQDAEFSRWRSAMILAYIRRSGYDAANRVTRLYAKGGLTALTDELTQLPSDWAFGLYLRAALQQLPLDAGTVATLTKQAKRVESDFELGQILGAIPSKFLDDEQVKAAFLDAAATMESDFEMRKVLGNVLKSGRPSPAVVGAMLDLAAKLDSDFELASLLVELSEAGSLPPGGEAAYLRAVRSIESDFERHRVLKALLSAGSHSSQTLSLALEASGDIESDFEQATWLKEVAAVTPIVDPLRTPWFRAAETIESDFELKGVLMTALRSAKPGSLIVGDVLRLAERIDSDFELASLLVAVANAGLVGRDERPAFRRALATIDADFERQRVLAAFGQRVAEL